MTAASFGEEMVLMVLPLLIGGVVFISFLERGWLSTLAQPIDGGRKYRGKPIFGKNKTWRGFLVMSLATGLAGVIITALFTLQNNLFVPFLMYTIVGAAYSIGELPNSFLKRRIGIKPGRKNALDRHHWWFWIADLWDGLVISAVVFKLWFGFSWLAILVAVVLGGLIHLWLDEGMRLLNLKE